MMACFRCALDKYLLTNLEYPTDLMAGREAHVYKYADRDNMYFDCQITLRIKEPGAEYCEVLYTKFNLLFKNRMLESNYGTLLQIPNCPDPPRRRRSNLLPTDGETNSTGDQRVELIFQSLFRSRVPGRLHHPGRCLRNFKLAQQKLPRKPGDLVDLSTWKTSCCSLVCVCQLRASTAFFSPTLSSSS